MSDAFAPLRRVQREKLRLSQAQCAVALGTYREVIGRIERGAQGDGALGRLYDVFLGLVSVSDLRAMAREAGDGRYVR